MTSLRSELIQRVREGRLSPDEADAQALLMGLEPLSYRPNLADYNPMSEVYWTPVMAIAWIAWRTPDAVRDVWWEYRRRCRVWSVHSPNVIAGGSIIRSFDLDYEMPASILDLHQKELSHRKSGLEDTIKITVGVAAEQFRDGLSCGRLEGSGVPLNGGSRMAIGALSWIDLRHDLAAGDSRFVHRAQTGEIGFRDVLVPREQVLRLWRPQLSQRSVALPALVRPDSEGYMTVFHALFWIATCGGSQTLEPSDGSRWDEAFSALLPEIASGKVELTGERAGERQIIPPHKVAACRFIPPLSDPSEDFLAGRGLFLRSNVYIDDEHWWQGFDDALVQGHDECWIRLMVPKQAVASCWPFDLAIPTKTGVPGRPTSKHLIIGEFERRKDEGETKSTLADEAKALDTWLQANHPRAPRMSLKTIANAVRDRFNVAKKP